MSAVNPGDSFLERDAVNDVNQAVILGEASDHEDEFKNTSFFAPEFKNELLASPDISHPDLSRLNQFDFAHQEGNDVNLEDLMKVSMVGNSQDGKFKNKEDPFTIGVVSNEISGFL